jgi:hypothetical protein
LRDTIRSAGQDVSADVRLTAERAGAGRQPLRFPAPPLFVAEPARRSTATRGTAPDQTNSGPSGPPQKAAASSSSPKPIQPPRAINH